MECMPIRMHVACAIGQLYAHHRVIGPPEKGKNAEREPKGRKRRNSRAAEAAAGLYRTSKERRTPRVDAAPADFQEIS